MIIYIETLTTKIITLDVEGSSTIKQIKKQLKKIEGPPLNQQRLIYAGMQLEDDKTLAYYNIQKESKIYLFLRLRGD